MIWLISWLIYGLIVGGIAKWLYHKLRSKDQEPVGIFSTLCVGVVGSYFGGFLNYLFFGSGSPFSTSGVIMGIVGATILLALYGVASNNPQPPDQNAV